MCESRKEEKLRKTRSKKKYGLESCTKMALYMVGLDQVLHL